MRAWTLADRLAVAVLVLLPFVLLTPAFLPGAVLSPAENVVTLFPWKALVSTPVTARAELFDVPHYFHPTLLYASDEIRAGRFPFWNPYQYAGVPFFSNPQSAILFPLTALAYVLPAPLALALAAALKLAGAGLAMFWFLRVVGGGPVPALVGALGFMLGSPMISWLQWTYSNATMLIPALFAAVEHLRQQATGRRVALLAVVVAFQLLAGYPQGSFHALLATAAWTLARAPGAPGGFLLRSVAAAALGGGVAAVQLLPFVDYVRESAVYAYRSGWTAPMHVPVQSAVTFVMPYFYGTGAERWGTWQFAIMTVFVGLVPVLAFPCGALQALREPISRFFVGLAVVAGGIHYGGPLVGMLAGAPGMSLGTNSRLMPVLAFAVCTLAALGLERATTGSVRLVRGWFAVLSVAVAVTVLAALDDPGADALTWPLPAQYLVALTLLCACAVMTLGWLRHRSPTWATALVACQLASLVPLAATYNPVRDADWFYPTPKAIAWLQRHREARAAMPGHVGSVYRIRLAQGYDGMTPRRVEELAGPLGSGNAGAAGFLENPLTLWGSEPLSAVAVLRSNASDLFGVRYVLLPPGAELRSPGLRLAYDGADARIFERPQALPRAFLVGRARCVDDADAIRLVRARAVDFRREVLLSDCKSPTQGEDPSAGDVAAILPGPDDRLRIRVSTAGPAYLVVTETWFPGWRASVDGRKAPVLRANHAFRAVWVPGGDHEVEFRFRPRGFREGLVVSVLAAASVLALALVRGMDRART